MAESRFVYVTYIRTTPEKLWQALTQPDFTRKFWVEIVQECEWKPGASWRIVKPNGETADSGEVLEIDPPKRLVLKWKNHLFPELAGEVSRLTYELEPKDETVKLTVIHESDVKDSQLIEKLSNGWPHLLSSLKSFLETGEPFEASRRWPKGM